MKNQIKEFQNKEQLISYLEKFRKKSLFLFVLFIVLASLFGASGLALLLVGLIAFTDATQIALVITGFLCFLAITPSFIIGSLHQVDQYQELVFGYFFKYLKKNPEYEDISFNVKADRYVLDKKLIAPLNLKFDYDKLFLIKGKVKGITFFSVNYQYTTHEKGHPVDRNGRYFQFDASLINQQLIIRNKVGRNFFKNVKLSEDIQSESISFNNQFSVSASDKTEGYAFLDAVRVDGLRTVAFDFQAKPSVFVSPYGVAVCFDDYQTLKIKFTTHIDDAFVNSFEREMNLPLRLAKALEVDKSK
jgi:hypothetical protein